MGKLHFTYSAPIEGQLQQGDLLHIRDELRTVLEDYHQYYASNEDYRYLMVLTQSCDLVRRNGQECKSKYITVAAVKPVERALDKELSNFQESDTEREHNLYSKEHRFYGQRIAKQLLNNNLKDYFYLQEEETLGLREPMVVFLKLSVALKAPDHYDKCARNVFCSLRAEFQAKLGWLVGDAYSRVGTKDWTDHFNEDELKVRMDSLFRSFVWPPESTVDAIRKAENKKRQENSESPILSDDELSAISAEHAQRKKGRRADFASAIINYANNKFDGIPEESFQDFKNWLLTDEEVNQYLARKYRF